MKNNWDLLNQLQGTLSTVMLSVPMITPPILSGDNAHGGVTLQWKCSINDRVTPMEDIISDRIVGIRLDFRKCDPLFILGVYLPATSAKHRFDDYLECLYFLWAIYDRLSSEDFVVILSDFNGDLGNSLGDKGIKEPNQRGLKLLKLANHSNLCPVNLLETYQGPTESFVSYGGWVRSTIDYVSIPNCLINLIVRGKTFESNSDNLSDHMPIDVAIKYTDMCHKQGVSSEEQPGRSKIYWSNHPCKEIYKKYVQPLLLDLEKVSDSSPLKADQITKLITNNSSQLLCSKKKKRGKSVFVKLPDKVKTARSFSEASFQSWKQNSFLNERGYS